MIAAKPRLSAPERRALILETSVRLFSEKGFRGTTTRELAAAAGVTEPVLYEHFRTKRDLYTAIIDTVSQDSLRNFTALTDEYAAREDDRGFLRALADRMIEWHQANADYVRLVHFAVLEGHELSQVCYDRMTRPFLELFAAYLRNRHERGALRSMNPELAALSIMSAVGSIGKMYVLFPGCAPAEAMRQELVEQLVSMIMDGICRPRSEAQ